MDITAKNIIHGMKKAYSESGYYGAYQVYDTVSLPYPTDNTLALVEAAKQTFVGTMTEIEAHLEKIKAESKEKHKQDLMRYNKENVEIRNALIHLAAKDALPSDVAENENLLKQHGIMLFLKMSHIIWLLNIQIFGMFSRKA